jgi:hypothetical protein
MGGFFSSPNEIMKKLSREVVAKILADWNAVARGHHGVPEGHRPGNASRTLIEYACGKMAANAGRSIFPKMTDDGFSLTNDEHVRFIDVLFGEAYSYMVLQRDGTFTKEQGMICLDIQRFIRHASNIAKANQRVGVDFNINHALLENIYGPPDAAISLSSLHEEVRTVQCEGRKFADDPVRLNGTDFTESWTRECARKHSCQTVFQLEGTLASVRTVQDTAQAAHNDAEAAVLAAPADPALQDAADVAIRALVEAMQVTNLFQTRLDAAVAARDALAAL